MAESLIEVENLNVDYLGTPVLNNVNFSVSGGKLIGIIGPNGAGKSTLMKAMLGLIKSTGNVTIAGSQVNHLKGKVAYIKQGSDYDLTFPILVKDAVMLGLYPAIGLLKRPNRSHRALVDEALTRVEMQSFKNRQIAELSGGQWQRVLIARMLIQNAEVLFLDEPFTGVDVDSEAKIMEVLHELRDEGKTIMMIYHDLENARRYFDEVILVNQTVMAYGETEHVLTNENLHQAYVRGGGKR